MMKLIWTIIGILILVHAYFYIRYQQIDPCAAALAKVEREDPAALPAVTAELADRNLGTIGRCYMIGIIGPGSAS
jgi:hypothetical protein